MDTLYVAARRFISAHDSAAKSYCEICYREEQEWESEHPDRECPGWYGNDDLLKQANVAVDRFRDDVIKWLESLPIGTVFSFRRRYFDRVFYTGKKEENAFIILEDDLEGVKELTESMYKISSVRTAGKVAEKIMKEAFGIDRGIVNNEDHWFILEALPEIVK